MRCILLIWPVCQNNEYNLTGNKKIYVSEVKVNLRTNRGGVE